MSGADEQDKRGDIAGNGSTAAMARSIVVADNRIDSRALLGESREIVIAHGSEIYRLRLTAQNKLILTK